MKDQIQTIKLKKEKRAFSYWRIPFFAGTGIYLEVLFHLAIYHKLESTSIYPVLFGATLGLFLAALTVWLPRIGNEIIAYGKENIARVPGGESGEPIIYMEVDSQTAKEWKRENNRACYLQKTMNALGIEVISYNVSPNTEDWEVNGEALLENPDCHVEDDVLRSILTENMLDAMCHLSEIEQEVITRLYLLDDPMTEHEFEKAFGVKRCTVHYYKVSALEKLRKMLSENV